MFYVLGAFIVLMVAFNLGIIFALDIFKIMSKVNIKEFSTVDKVLLYFNVISMVSMIGVTLTLVFSWLFFRKIKADFVRKSLRESMLLDKNLIN